MNKSLRAKVYEIVEVRDTFASKLFDAFILTLILINVLVIVLDTELSFRQQYREYFELVETFSVAIFSLEYVLRVWTAPHQPHLGHFKWPRLKYMLTPMALIDFFAVAPYYLVGLVTMDPLYLRVIRLVRLFKLTRYSHSMDMLLTVLRKEANSLYSAIFILFMMLLLASAGIYLVEGTEQPEVFGSIPRSIWWAAVTLTTVGYGDVVPHTLGGKALAMVISVLGIGIAALPAGIIAAGFNREIDLRKAIYESEAREALADGEITRAERRHLNKERLRLGLVKEEAREIVDSLLDAVEIDEAGGYHCPHCGEEIGKKSKTDHRA